MNPSSKSKTVNMIGGYDLSKGLLENLLFPTVKSKTTKPKKDWVDKLIDSGLTGHKPKKKAKHRCRFEWPRVSDSWGNVQKTCRCGRRKGRL